MYFFKMTLSCSCSAGAAAAPFPEVVAVARDYTSASEMNDVEALLRLTHPNAVARSPGGGLVHGRAEARASREKNNPPTPTSTIPNIDSRNKMTAPLSQAPTRPAHSLHLDCYGLSRPPCRSCVFPSACNHNSFLFLPVSLPRCRWSPRTRPSAQVMQLREASLAPYAVLRDWARVADPSWATEELAAGALAELGAGHASLADFHAQPEPKALVAQLCGAGLAAAAASGQPSVEMAVHEARTRLAAVGRSAAAVPPVARPARLLGGQAVCLLFCPPPPHTHTSALAPRSNPTGAPAGRGRVAGAGHRVGPLAGGLPRGPPLGRRRHRGAAARGLGLAPGAGPRALGRRRLPPPPHGPAAPGAALTTPRCGRVAAVAADPQAPFASPAPPHPTTNQLPSPLPVPAAGVVCSQGGGGLAAGAAVALVAHRAGSGPGRGPVGLGLGARRLHGP